MLGFGTMAELSKAVGLLFPTAILTTDADGEIVILTGYKEAKNGRVRLYDIIPKKV